MLPDGFPVCRAADVEEAKALAKLNPTYIAVEPPELIGGDISVTTADPAIVSDTVAAVKSVQPKVRVLCGAGVKSGKTWRRPQTRCGRCSFGQWRHQSNGRSCRLERLGRLAL